MWTRQLSIVVGHETTSNTLSWLLYELARHPHHQALLREEIQAVRSRVAARGDSDLSANDLDSMHIVVATIKEILRLHPIVYFTVRVPTRDEVLPLAYPVTNVDGETVNEIPIPKGTNLYLSIWTYNRYDGAHLQNYPFNRSTGCHKYGALTHMNSTLPDFYQRRRRRARHTSVSLPTS